MNTADTISAPPAGESPQLILASGSPRRRELFERFFGVQGFTVLVPLFDETQMADLPPDMQALRLPAGKLQALRSQFTLPDAYAALAADTLVALGSQVFGKPRDPTDAACMLRQLSGRVHEVKTGLCLAVRWQGTELVLQATETTRVTFAELTDDMIQWYIATGEPLDKAGAYGIQGAGAALVERIDGCYYNVMGLPVFRLMALLRQAAVHFDSPDALTHFLPWR
jgi:septum formation protein